MLYMLSISNGVTRHTTVWRILFDERPVPEIRGHHRRGPAAPGDDHAAEQATLGDPEHRGLREAGDTVGDAYVRDDRDHAR